MRPVQGTLDDLGTALHDVTFVVVDLETTGATPADSAITEVGAVKVRAGEVLGEFQTLVNPGAAIPAFIQVLTGISDAMVAAAPPVAAVLPAFLEFARGSVLVAHNARFDVAFLRAAAADSGLQWPAFPVIDTVTLARRVVASDEVANRRLSTLASHFRAGTVPDHRALHDARATVDVLHALLERVGNLGVRSLEELRSYTRDVPTSRRRKRVLADDLPDLPGVYVFVDEAGRPLYVGTSRNIRARARSYFTAAEQRSRMAEMVALAHRIQPIVCQTSLEARVQELRLLAEHKPPYNRRSTRPEASRWVKLTDERFPRLAVVHRVRDDGGRYAGPFSTRAAAEAAIAAVHEVLPLRQCTARLTGQPLDSACVLAELGRCGAPCVGRQSAAEYSLVSEAAARVLVGDARDVVRALSQRLRSLGEQQRFEDAAAVRDRMASLLRGAARAQRLAPLAATPELLAARRTDSGGWELVCVRHGRLAGTSVAPRGADPLPYVEALRATSEVPARPCAPAPAAHAAETELLLRWLERARLVDLDGQWTCPVGGAAAFADPRAAASSVVTATGSTVGR